MPDPLSVAGTAVGIASLGIQVCQGLIQYLRAVRGRKEDIRDGICEIEQVVSSLYSLNSLLLRIGPQADTTTLRRCLNNCYAKLESLQKVLGNLGDIHHSSNVTKRAANAVRSVTYPFQQEKITGIRQSLRSVLSDLNLIISIISLDSEATIQRTASTISQNLEAHVSTHASDISDLKIKMDSNSVQLRSLQNTISGTLDNIKEQLHRTELSIRDLDQKVDGKLSIIESGTQAIQDSNEVTVAQLEKIARALVSQSALISNMGVQIKDIKTLPDTGFVAAEQDLNLQKRYSSLTKTRSSRSGYWHGCHCATTIPHSVTYFHFWNMSFKLEERDHHLPSCKLYGTKKGMKRTFKTTLPLKLAWLTARMTVACFEYTSGTSRPGLTIRCRNVVKLRDSPVYKICDSFYKRVKLRFTTEQIVHELDLLERGILNLYSSNQASPGDVDYSGLTHAEIMFDSVKHWSKPRPLLDRILQDNVLTHALIACLQTLIQASDTDKADWSFSKSLTRKHSKFEAFQTQTTNTRYLLSFLSREDVFQFSSWVVLKIIGKEPSEHVKAVIHDALELSPIAKAILTRRLGDLYTCVSKDPTSVFEGVSGISALLLAIAWPEGLRYLLTTEAKILIDRVCYIDTHRPFNPGLWLAPINGAIYLNQADSADILLGADCYLDLDRAPYGYVSDKTSDEQIFAIIATHLGERRVRLLQFVQDKLGLFLDQTSVTFADSAAAAICEALDLADILLHPILRVNSGYKSIYFQKIVPLTAFRLFWEAGFHFQGRNHIGLTSIMTHETQWWRLLRSGSFDKMMDTTCWLVEKGFMHEKATDPLNLGLNVHATGYHYVGAFVAGDHFSCSWHVRSLLDIIRIKAESLSEIAVEDNCVCWCNMEGHGCSPTKVLLKTLFRKTSEYFYYYQPVRKVMLNSVSPNSASQSNGISFWDQETLHFLTFEALEMTHTCCVFERVEDHDPYQMAGSTVYSAIFSCDPEIVLETRSCSQEQATASILKELMTEFTEQFQLITPGPTALITFIYTYWRRRISELYRPDYQVAEDLRQYRTFRGFQASSEPSTGVMSENLSCVLGEDFLLADPNIALPLEGTDQEEIDRFFAKLRLDRG